MDYLNALRLIHQGIEPLNYCEIGCRFGGSLALSKSPSVGIDPALEIREQIMAPTRLFRMTSDEFFAAHDLRALLGGAVDFAFIDGMHLAELALRDFANLERASHPQGAIAIDDLLPGHIDYASRERNTKIWTGDVYRVIPILRHYRPDLDIRIYDVEMKGFCLVSGLDPSSSVLFDRRAGIEADLMAGRWTLASAEEIRTTLAPKPVDCLADDVAQLAAARRTGRAATAASSTTAYLDLLKRSVLNEIYLDDELRIVYLRACLAGEDRYDPAVLHDVRNVRRDDYMKLAESRRIGFCKIKSGGFNHSMMGRERIENLHDCLDIVREEQIPGDLVECGVWRGGGCIFMAGYARAYGMDDRRILVVDSFDGLPPPTVPQDAGLDLSKEKYPELAVSLETVQENFAVYDLLDPKVVFLEGWFKDTLPDVPVSQIALLRMDGDLYESTMDILVNLYAKVVPDGVVIVDDFNAIPACRQAVFDFFQSRGLPVPQLHKIDWTGVWFRKSREAAQAGAA